MIDEQAELDSLTHIAQAPTINELLKQIDYTNLNLYRPSLFAIGYVEFIKMVNDGEGEENTTPAIHYRMLDELVTDKPRSSLANLIFRGAAKTTVFGEYLILYLATYGKLPKFGTVDLGIYITDSIDNGVKNMRKNLEYRYDNSEFLKEVIPEAKFTDNRWEFTNADGKKLIFKGYGAKTGVRGTKELGKRPQIAVIDDIVSDEDAESDTVLKKINDTVKKAIRYAVHPKKHIIIWSGTPFNARDPLYQAIESGAWKVNVFPVCEKFPCSRQEFVSAWPDRFTYDYVYEKYLQAKKEGDVNGFYQELMLQIMSADQRIIHDEDLNEYRKQTLMVNFQNFNTYITTDFGVSDTKRADLSALTVWAVNYKKQVFWVDGIARRQEMDKNIDDLFELNREYEPISVGIEVSGQQRAFIKWLTNEMMARNNFFTMASANNDGKPGIMPINKTNKFARFKEILPWFKLGYFHFPTDVGDHHALIELFDELEKATTGGFKSKYDDVADTITQLLHMNIWYPNPPATPMGMRTMYGASHHDEHNDTSSAMDSYTC